MVTSELFIEGYNLPLPLSSQESDELLEKIKQGNEEAREKIIEHNIRLVIHEVNSRFNTVDYDKKELVSIGIVGLIKAVSTFDTSKKNKFSTYAVRCIDNEILMFLRKLNKSKIVDSLDRQIKNRIEENMGTLIEILRDDTDFEEEYFVMETHQMIRKIIKTLPEREKKIIMLYFGFYNNETYSQKEISRMIGISQSFISRLMRKILKELEEKFKEAGIVEIDNKEESIKKIEGPKKYLKKRQ